MTLEELQRQFDDSTAQAEAALDQLRKMIDGGTLADDIKGRFAEIDRKIASIEHRVAAGETTTKALNAIVKHPFPILDDDDGE